MGRGVQSLIVPSGTCDELQKDMDMFLSLFRVPCISVLISLAVSPGIPMLNT